MNKIFKTALIIALGSFALSSCKESNEYDYEAEYLKSEQKTDSLLSAQKVKIEAYKNEFLPNAIEDTLTNTFTYLNKKVKRGIWYHISAEATDNSYTYGLDAAGSRLLSPKLKLKYTVSLLNSTTPVESDLIGTDYNLGVQDSKITPIWLLSFFPYSVQFNGNPIILGGLTKNGLKKGNKITVITPSLYAYGANTKTNIPANSPLVYTFEVLEISNP